MTPIAIVVPASPASKTATRVRASPDVSVSHLSTSIVTLFACNGQDDEDSQTLSLSV